MDAEAAFSFADIDKNSQASLVKNVFLKKFPFMWYESKVLNCQKLQRYKRRNWDIMC